MNGEKMYTLTVNEAQLKAINVACEEYFRLRLGQVHDLADDWAGTGCDFSLENENHDRIFDDFIRRRNDAKAALETAYRIATQFPGFGRAPCCLEIGENAKICQDVWQVIRHKLWQERQNHSDSSDSWCVDSKPPFPVSGMPLVKCEKVNQND